MNTTRFLPGEEILNFDTALLIRQQANEHWVAGEGEARCSLWWTAAPSFEGEKLGVIGHFSAESTEAGKTVLEQATLRLAQEGCTLAIGPMDGNTWRRYRLVTERGTEPPFFMEPDNPAGWSAIFESAGFGSFATYSSSLVKDLSRRDPRAERARERLLRGGVQIRSLDLDHYEADLRRIYSVSVESFTANLLYTELSESDFLAQYLPYRDKIRPDLVLLAEKEGVPVGYLFALPDFNEAARGQSLQTVIGKTLAVRAGKAFGGLGVVLTDQLHERAASLGYTRLIHALQYEGNSVRNMSEFFGKVMRRYTLYSRRLA